MESYRTCDSTMTLSPVKERDITAISNTLDTNNPTLPPERRFSFSICWQLEPTGYLECASQILAVLPGPALLIFDKQDNFNYTTCLAKQMGNSMQRVAIVLVVFIVLSSCALTSKSDLLKSENNVRYCQPNTAEQVASRVKSILTSCFVQRSTSSMMSINKAFVPMTYSVEWTVADEITPFGNVITLELESNKTFVLAADVRGATDSCVSTLQLFARNKRWEEKSFDAIHSATLHDEITCPPSSE